MNSACRRFAPSSKRAQGTSSQRYLTPARVADELQATVVSVRRWIATRELRASKAGPRRWMIRRSDLDCFDGRRPAGTGPAVRRPPRSDLSACIWCCLVSIEQAKGQLELSERRWVRDPRGHAATA